MTAPTPWRHKLIGLLTWGILLYVIVALATLVTVILGPSERWLAAAVLWLRDAMGDSGSGEATLIVFRVLALVVVANMLAIVVVLGVATYYLLHLFTNPKLSGAQRLWWLLGFIVTGPAGHLAYFYTAMPPSQGRTHRDHDGH